MRNIVIYRSSICVTKELGEFAIFQLAILLAGEMIYDV